MHDILRILKNGGYIKTIEKFNNSYTQFYTEIQLLNQNEHCIRNLRQGTVNKLLGNVIECVTIVSCSNKEIKYYQLIK